MAHRPTVPPGYSASTFKHRTLSLRNLNPGPPLPSGQAAPLACTEANMQVARDREVTTRAKGHEGGYKTYLHV
eukprot:287372-Hanusia_phi.AAC.4